MRAIEIARIFKGRRTGKGKWMAKCPVHKDRMASLEIKEGKNAGTTVVGCYAGCDKKDVLDAVGLRLCDLFEKSRDMTPELRLRIAEGVRMDLWKRQNELAIWLQVSEPEHKNYWRAVERNTGAKIQAMQDRWEPEERRRREQAERVQAIIAEYGFEDLMECVEWSQVYPEEAMSLLRGEK